MRYIYIALIVLLTGVVLVFKFQNLTSVTISLLDMSATLPVSTLVILVYLLGMVTGSAMFGLVRNWTTAPHSRRVDRRGAIVCPRGLCLRRRYGHDFQCCSWHVWNGRIPVAS